MSVYRTCQNRFSIVKYQDSRNMSEEKQAPMPLWQDTPRPSWPSKWELTESLVTKDNQEFPRGGNLLKPMEYHVLLYFMTCNFGHT